ncbi:MAG: hypothetical protein COW13_02240 [Candidatus Omnitrophica bacterium CG12_big_fil_rev_8_21_14_0_65_50_5]|nr:MAG: hypothetical protein COW13_02240 [Candidatus Omnitrophica bacterium CG12_big_fil_rev_8_21_14_0_65_50_5]
MNVTLAVLADYANVTKENKINILGIFDTIYSKVFPFVWHSMQLVMKFEYPRAEADSTKNIIVKLMDEDGKTIFQVGGEFKLTKPQNNILTIQANHFLILNSLRFEKPGNYQFSILVNEDAKKSIELKVIQVK